MYRTKCLKYSMCFYVSHKQAYLLKSELNDDLAQDHELRPNHLRENEELLREE